MTIFDLVRESLVDAVPVFAALGLAALLAGAWMIGFIQIQEQIELDDQQRQDTDIDRRS